MQSMFDLTGQIAYITGGANGLGFAMAEVLAAHGAHVVIADSNPIAIESAVAALLGQGHRAEATVVDVTATAALRASIDAVAARHGRLDILVANAGLSAGPGPLAGGRLHDVDAGRWARVLDTNLTATFEAIRSVAPHMRQRQYGRIVVIASVAGMRAEPMCGYAYAASKAALLNLVRQCAMELSRDKIMINAISPGPFRTGFGSGRLLEGDASAFASAVMLGRLGSPEEIKGAALLLCSPAASFMTGSNIVVDGGTSAH